MFEQPSGSVANPAKDSTAVQISSARWETALRLKSWLPEHRRGSQPIVLEGRGLPRRVGTTTQGSISVLCLAPGEWLLLSDESATEVRSRLDPSLRENGIAVTNWSAAFAVFAIEGGMTRTLLAKGCGLDFDPEAFPPGRCARTRFAQVVVILKCLEESVFELAVARSHANYLHGWLVDATTEWESATST